jgi:hypothetical protein
MSASPTIGRRLLRPGRRPSRRDGSVAPTTRRAPPAPARIEMSSARFLHGLRARVGGRRSETSKHRRPRRCQRQRDGAWCDQTRRPGSSLPSRMWDRPPRGPHESGRRPLSCGAALLVERACHDGAPGAGGCCLSVSSTSSLVPTRRHAAREAGRPRFATEPSSSLL